MKREKQNLKDLPKQEIFKTYFPTRKIFERENILDRKSARCQKEKQDRISIDCVGYKLGLTWAKLSPSWEKAK